MYASRENKEKVSRRIDGSCNAMKIRDAHMHMIAQLSFGTIAKKNCIQLLKMQKRALAYDFRTYDRREKYFSTENINFYNEHRGKGVRLNHEHGELETNDKKQNITFLTHPLRDMMPLKGINTVAQNEKLKRLIQDSIHGIGYMSNTYSRKYSTDSFEESLEQQLLKYKEVMFIKKGTTMYFAPNGKDNIKLSHPSLLGGYPYEVDDAGTLKIHNREIVAIEDSGHYGKTGGQINKEITNMLLPVRRI